MRITKLNVVNFRAISSLSMENLDQMVVVAGPNGCGKSTVFDAIRLLKSAYGDYSGNELQLYHSEFQLKFDRNSAANLLPLFRKTTEPMSIEAELTISNEEKSWLLQHAERLIQLRILRETNPQFSPMNISGTSLPLAALERLQSPKVKERLNEELMAFEEALKRDLHVASLQVDTAGEASFSPSLLLEIVFGIYEPKHIGIFDYHGAQRNYEREQLGGINLRIESDDKRHSQHALYNWKNKYTNIKTELAAEYVRDLIAEKAGLKVNNKVNLTETLREMFSIFFEGKEFIGPEPTPELGLTFNVRLSDGSVHDINELSSGEKELLFGYLRLRNSGARNSVILIDEPELHLNPRLTNGLVDFYFKHLGLAQENQLWLVTHSDSILRQAVNQAEVSVFHMQAASETTGSNQLTPVFIDAELDRAIIDLVGDLAVYTPGKKLVILEGDVDVEFDQRMISTLFPEFAASVNLLSSGDKRRVKNLHDLLDDARKSGALPVEVFSITDRDFDSIDSKAMPNRKAWDCFHIENFLLETKFVLKVLRIFAISPVPSEDLVLQHLKECASETQSTLVKDMLENYIFRQLVGDIKLKIDPNSSNLPHEFADAVTRSLNRLSTSAESLLSEEALEEKERELNETYHQHLEDDRWLLSFRGRDILKRYVHQHLRGRVSYESFRDLILSEMRRSSYKPRGMQRVLDEILGEKDGNNE